MARFFADENFDYAICQELRLLGHDVVTAQEAGLAQRRVPDAQILAFAIAQARAVLTFNRRHFIRLHRQVKHSAALALRIHQAILAVPALDNGLLRVIRPQGSP